MSPSMLGISPGGGEKVNLCSMEVKKMNSSILARFSPRHALLPKGEALSMGMKKMDKVPSDQWKIRAWVVIKSHIP